MKGPGAQRLSINERLRNSVSVVNKKVDLGHKHGCSKGKKKKRERKKKGMDFLKMLRFLLRTITAVMFSHLRVRHF